MQNTKESLYDAVGGHATLQKVHKLFYDKVYADDWLKQFFDGFNQEIIENKQTSFMAEKMGGPKYLGKPVKQVHENLYITDELFQVRHILLEESLIEVGVSKENIKRWLRIDSAFMRSVCKDSIESFYRDYHFPYKKRIIIPRPEEQKNHPSILSTS
jgi:hemoglobin